jgi:large subunit ribosomal protein L10
MPKTEKVERVAELKAQIESSNALLLAEYRGLTVSEITELRRSLREADTSFAVVKNTLMARAAVEAGIQDLESYLAGPSAVAFVDGDPVSAAKKIKAVAKLFPSLVLKGGFMDGRVLTAEDAGALADLESREVMLSKIAGLLKSDMSKAAALFVSAQSKFLSLLEAYKEKVPGGEAPEAAPAEVPEAEAEAEAPPEPDAEAEPAEATAEEPAEAQSETQTDEEGKE